MKKTYLAMAVAAASLVAQPALAQDYQMEAGLSYISYDYDAGGDDSAIGVDFRYNFETVSTAGKPLAEAQFLGRNGGVGLSYSDQDKVDYTNINIGADYWFEDIYVAAELNNYDVGFDDGNNYQLTGGYMVSDSMLAYATYLDGDGYSSASFLLGAKYVADMGGNYANLEAVLGIHDGLNNLGLVGDYFLNRELSVGAFATISDDTDIEEHTFGVAAKYFITPVVSGELEYAIQDKDSAIGIRLAARF